MRLIRGVVLDEGELRYCNLARKHYNSKNSTLDKNTLSLAVYFDDTEFDKILQYDKERQENNKKIMLGTAKSFSSITIINPSNCEGAVASGLITILEIIVQGKEYYSFKSSALKLLENCAFKNLCIVTSMDFTLQSLHAEDIIRLINIYKGTLHEIIFHFEKVDMTAFSKIEEEVENWIINTHITPLKIYLTANYDIDNNPCKSLPEYNDMHERLQFLIYCKYYSKLLQTTTEKQKSDELCLDIVEYNREFTRGFSKYAPSQIKKFMSDNHTYNILLGYYIDNSAILNRMSEWCYKDKGQYLPHNIKKCIVERIGGIGVIIGIDNDLENNNGTTDRQDKVINHAEAVNDVDLTTNGTIADCCFCIMM